MSDQKHIQITLAEHRQRIQWLKWHIMEALDIYGHHHESMPVKVCIKHSPDVDHVRVRIGEDTWDFEYTLGDREILEQMVEMMHRIADVKRKGEEALGLLVSKHGFHAGFEVVVDKWAGLHFERLHDDWDWGTGVDDCQFDIKNADSMTVDEIVDDVLKQRYEREAAEREFRAKLDENIKQRPSLTAEKPKIIWQKLKRIFQ